jgi:hypothetical protein
MDSSNASNTVTVNVVAQGNYLEETVAEVIVFLRNKVIPETF